MCKISKSIFTWLTPKLKYYFYYKFSVNGLFIKKLYKFYEVNICINLSRNKITKTFSAQINYKLIVLINLRKQI